MKHNSFIDAFDVCARVIYFNHQILLVALTMCILLMLVTATLLFYLKPGESDSDASGHDDGSDDFDSVLATMYLTIMMLTGQGQPEGNLPWYTKLVCCLTAFLSVPIFVIPSSMLTWGFEAEAERLVKVQHDRYKEEVERVARGELEPISSESSSEGEGVRSNEAWAMYEETIAGSDEEEEEDTGPKGGAGEAVGAQEQNRGLRVFQMFDRDSSGLLSIEELVRALGTHDSTQLLLSLDIDQSGSVNIAEWLGYLAQVREQHNDTVLRMFLYHCEQQLGLWKEVDKHTMARKSQDHGADSNQSQLPVGISAGTSDPSDKQAHSDHEHMLLKMMERMETLTKAVEKVQGDVENLTQVLNTKLQ